jgi:galactosamine-6-phosphate isomerase
MVGVKSSAALCPLRLCVAKDYQAMSRWAADFIEADTKAKPDLLLCASAGASPTGTYEQLARRHEKGPKIFKRFRVVQIDEWGGLARGNPATCRTDLQTKLLEPLRIDANRFAGFISNAANPKSECTRITSWLARYGPIDICLLGLGLNGHIAMNEPADQFVPHVHVARLARRSLSHGMLKHLAKKPRYGLTLGMADILHSRRILLVVSGRAKRSVLKRLFEPHVSPRFPASFLWLHPDVTVICDREAATNGMHSS